MKLKKLMMVEVFSIVLVVALILIGIEVTPYLASSEQYSSIGIYNTKSYGRGNVTIKPGQTLHSEYFNYSTFDPAILVLDLEFQTWESPGDLVLSVNYREFATVTATSENPKQTLNVISCSGADWVEPFSVYSQIMINAIYFTSKTVGGYAGTFNYTINIRGSR